jgi:hypothetical protein
MQDSYTLKITTLLLNLLTAPSSNCNMTKNCQHGGGTDELHTVTARSCSTATELLAVPNYPAISTWHITHQMTLQSLKACMPACKSQNITTQINMAVRQL